MRSLGIRLDRLEGRNRADPYAHLSDDQLTDMIERLTRQIAGDVPAEELAETYSRVTGWPVEQSRAWLDDTLARRA